MSHLRLWSGRCLCPAPQLGLKKEGSHRMKKLITVLMLLTATMAFADAHIKDEDSKGVPTFVTGDLGKLTAKNDKAAKDFLKAQKHLLPMTGNEDFDAVATSVDQFGQTHIKFQQKIRGLKVVGA